VGFMNRHCQGGAVVDERVPELDQTPSSRVTVKGFLPVWDTETCRKLEIALLLLATNSPISEPRVRVLEPEDWADSWKAYFPVQHIGQHIAIVPSWIEYVAQPGEVVLLIDPGMAFGTGLHATTRLCLAAIEELVQPGQRVLDVGCGSGILAIAAALHGAEEVVAIDIDAVSVEVTRENIARNSVTQRVRVERGTLGDEVPGHLPVHTGTDYDLLLVNILAEIIIGMATALPRALRPSGRAVFSGIIIDKAEAVQLALERAGLVVDERRQEEHWVALLAHKP
jgi:ribosomal protein L11 methyltransferase